MARDLIAPYCTTYQLTDGELQEQKFFRKDDNDQFAKGLEFMGATNITKSFLNKAVGQWYRYHNESLEVLQNSAD